MNGMSKPISLMILAIVSLTNALPTSTFAKAEPKTTQTAQTPNRPHMTDTVFWSIIDKTLAAKSNPDLQISMLNNELMKLSTEEIVAFNEAFARQISSAYTWKLWGAAYIVNGGASDDGFEYFRRWLVAQGSRVFKEVLIRPDNLANFVPRSQDDVLEFEEFGTTAVQVWMVRSGLDQDKFPLPNSPVIEMGSEPSGTRFEESEEFFARHYPKTWRRFGERPLG